MTKHDTGQTVTTACRICGDASPHPAYDVKEMMFGMGESFRYFQCVRCGCLQIQKYPANLTRYYPSNYYSFDSPASRNLLLREIVKIRNRYALTARGLVGRLLYSKVPNPALKSLAQIPLSRNSKILDVGCGSGSIPNALGNLGYMHVVGIDPFIDQERTFSNGVKILKSSILEIHDEWDVIMFHHSLEHMPDQHRVFKKISELLEPDGICIIRIPTVSSYVWKQYGVHWVQLDAPRHYYLHSVESITTVAGGAGLVVRKIVYDSTGFQFWGSEQYKGGIPLRSEKSVVNGVSRSIFSRSGLKRFEQEASRLNAREEGDQMAVYLTKEGRGSLD